MNLSYFGLTVFPLLAALILAISGNLRKFLVPVSAIIIMVSGITFVNAGQLQLLAFPGLLEGTFIAELIVVTYLLLCGLKLKNPWIIIFNLIQIGVLIYAKFFTGAAPEVNSEIFMVDSLTKVLILLVTVIGPLICIFAIPYMKEYEKHKGLTKSKQARFFFLLFLFLGGMGILVTANHFSLLALGWEITTLCSFMLIGHNGDAESIKNSTRALVINSFGGIFLTIGAFISEKVLGVSTLSQLITGNNGGNVAILVVAFFAIAGLTKAAQMPFQSWLLGAMVAPTPVSALLHSSTMVKAGVYLIVRLAPAYQGTLVSTMLAIIGGFTFAVTAALAISQSNGKRILAYSTISNLGLIVMCAGINTPMATGAAIFLMIFHAISKALLFMCVGTIELKIGSKDIESMHGLVEKMPFIAFAALIGMITMFLPPFGMVAGKWVAMEAAADLPLVMLLSVLGSALTIVFWLRWAGTIMTTTKSISDIKKESYPLMLSLPLIILVAGAMVLSMLTDFVYQKAVLVQTTVAGSNASNSLHSYLMGPVFTVLAIAIVVGLIMSNKAKSKRVTTPYMCGVNSLEPEKGKSAFYAPMEKVVKYKTGNYYLGNIINEKKLTSMSNVIASLLIVIMLGVIKTW